MMLLKISLQPDHNSFPWAFKLFHIGENMSVLIKKIVYYYLFISFTYCRSEAPELQAGSQ